MQIQDSRWQSGAGTATVDDGLHAGTGGAEARNGAVVGSRSAPLRVDAQRNLEHVLRAAREVFGELGYGAPMEDVARRARVGVGTVYRRFPSKDVLVRRIAEEETSRLTEQARAALGQEEEPWSALSRFLRTSVASGAGRLLPPQVLRVHADDAAVPFGEESDDAARVPSQRGVAEQTDARVVVPRAVPAEERDDAGASELLEVVGRLVDRAREAGELRADVTVADVLLVIATAAPALPDAVQQAAASTRLLDILLEGLRSR
ncbi:MULTISPECIES: TetR/AcrR family transcriptional regulator [unclassified Streptomyces]|uniref:TetR/AcrR family transcriptional regulator n=1 Tax=unclassified Streptomyces TaxID=2593676 RepID=UPI0006F289F8|nr:MULTISPECIES: TetR/AcrR family transcriptional regulator [unclassified Streptomyces]KQX49294.1 TetR family transcriptional regulator [Streptomyces sp. Root1304]KRA78912.1 TetR family transcriptional regulator [Streptomyces sp. Root66D1]